MREALCDVPGVEHVLLEFDLQGNGLLRVQVRQDQDHAAILGAAVQQMRHRLGLDGDQRRLRITDPTGRPVLAVVETLLPPGTVRVAGAASAASTSSRPVVAAAAAPEPAPSPRVVVERVLVSTERQLARATVQLRCGDVVYSGTATGQGSGPGLHRALGTAAAAAIASATASAVEAVVGAATRLDAQQVDLLEVGTDHVAVVVLALLSDTGIERLTGSALVRHDPRDAVVRATLDALNRRAGIGGARSGAGEQ